jgi:hypothetical protein
LFILFLNVSHQKLKQLVQLRTPGVPLLSPYLEAMGISGSLQQYYFRSGWLSRIGYGAYIWPGDELDWQGIVFALQSQLGMSVHVGAGTALSLAGYSHYLRTGEERVFLFTRENRDLPKWAWKYSGLRNLCLCHTGFLPDETIGFINIPHKTFELRISCQERAILEALYLAPEKMDYVEAYQLMENLATLRPKMLQELLEKCRSVKVKRLFLLYSREAGHAWAHRIDQSRVDLGSGIRSLAADGVYIQDYGLVVPKELASLWS